MVDSFAELGLNEQILAGVADLGFTNPTPVQEKAIPAVLEGRDVVASAQTGTGKTAAFALPVLQVIAPLSAAARREPALTADADDTQETTVDEPAPQEAAGDPDPTDDAEEEAEADDPQGAEDDTTEARVLLDEVEVAHARVPAEAAGVDVTYDKAEGAPTPRRRRARRRHKRVDAPATDAVTDAHETPAAHDAGEAPTVPGPTADDGPADTPASGDEAPRKKRRRRRGRRRGAKVTEEANAPEAPSADEPAEGGAGQEDRAPHAPKDAEGAPKKKRRRKRSRRKDRAESLAPDPNARPFGPFALVVTPTRELAQQIERVVTSVCAHTGQRAVIVMGGAKLDRQIRELERGCDMLVATPGRLIDLMEHGHVDLKDVSVLVLDEADRMLDMGFWPSVRRIIAALPTSRQNLLFSATIPPSIKPQIDAMLTDPVIIEISRVGETATTVEEHLMPVTQGQKTPLLLELIRRGTADADAPLERMLVFCRTKQRADDVSRSLSQAGVSVDVMHSDRPQSAREKALRKFREGACQVLVATDVMSRGIDVVGIDAVVNFDVPLDPEDYVHRIGRTGRAGATGHAYTFVAPDEIGPLREIEFFTHKLIPTSDLEDFAYDEGRIVPGATRQAEKPKHTMFSGSRSRGRGIAGGRYGRHY